MGRGATQGQYRWRLVAGNGRIVCAGSEAFSRMRDARRNARLTMKTLAAVLIGGIL